MEITSGMTKTEEVFNPREKLFEQLRKVMPDVPYSPMVKYVQPYIDVVAKAKNGFIDLENVAPEKLKFWSDPHFGHFPSFYINTYCVY